MAKRTPSTICNVALVGHGGVGKTTFVDHVLHDVGFSNRAGDVDAGSSLSDYDAEERERAFSINSTIFHFEAEGRQFNLVDTPGYIDFCGAAFGALAAVETAVVAINARDGIQLNTRRMWQAAGERGLARAILITRVDSDNVEFDALVARIREEFGNECQLAFLPVGLGADCRGVVNLLEAESAPDGIVGDFAAAQEALRETIVESDDDLMMRYLEGEEVSQDELTGTLGQAVAGGTLVPILCCAAKADIGVRQALAFLAASAPSPADGAARTATAGEDEEVELVADPGAPLCAQVFKSITDVHVGRVAYVRLFQGSLGGDLTAKIARTGNTERLGHIYLCQGEAQEEVQEAVAGDIIAVPRMEELELNDTLCAESADYTMPPLSFPKPMMSLAVGPQSRDDDQKIATGLRVLAEGDPTLACERDAQSAELVITGMSNLHLNVAFSRLKRRYDVAVQTREPSVPYRETITKPEEGHHRHKKQTGGRGQYGEVYLRVEPNERGAGFEFVDEVVGGNIPRQFIPAVEKGIREVLDRGPVAGYPVVDVKAAVYDGTYHSVDSSEAAFKIAGGRAFSDGFMKARPTLLEPIAEMEVTIPPEYMGDVTGNLTGHRGRILGMDQEGTMQVIKAEIPMAELGRYSTELKSMTGGEGSFTLEFSHYAPVPNQLQAEIVARSKKSQD